MRFTFPYLAKMSIGASAIFKYHIKLPAYPARVARILIASDANIQLGGDLFNRLIVRDDIAGGEHKQQVDIDGALVLGGIAGDVMEFLTDIEISGINLVAATTKLLIQFDIIAGGP